MPVVRGRVKRFDFRLSWTGPVLRSMPPCPSPARGLRLIEDHERRYESASRNAPLGEHVYVVVSQDPWQHSPANAPVQGVPDGLQHLEEPRNGTHVDPVPGQHSLPAQKDPGQAQDCPPLQAYPPPEQLESGEQLNGIQVPPRTWPTPVWSMHRASPQHVDEPKAVIKHVPITQQVHS